MENKNPSTTHAEELERVIALVENVITDKTEEKEQFLPYVLGSLMSGSCSTKEQAENAEMLRIFLEALRIVEQKHGVKLPYTESVAEYLDGEQEPPE